MAYAIHRCRKLGAVAAALCVVFLACRGAQAQDKPSSVTIGAIVPLTGAGAQYGARMQQGIALALDEINGAGGVRGTKIAVRYADTGDQPSNGPNALRRFKEFDQIPFSLISNSNVTLAALPVAEQLKVVLLNGGAQSDKLIGASPWLFSDIPATAYESKVLAAWCLGNLGKSSVVTYQTDPVGQSAYEGWKRDFQGGGGRILAAEGVAFEQGDYRSVLTKLRPAFATANLWFVGGTYGEDAKRLLNQARALGVKTQIVSESATVATIAPEDASLKGIIHVRLRAHPTPAFADRFKAKYHADPDFYAAAYYNGVMIFAKALERAIDNKYGLDGEAIRRSIHEVHDFDFGAGAVDFDDKNSTVSGLEVVKVGENGMREVLTNK